MNSFLPIASGNDLKNILSYSLGRFDITKSTRGELMFDPADPDEVSGSM